MAPVAIGDPHDRETSMKIRILVGSVLLASTALVGVAAAATDFGRRHDASSDEATAATARGAEDGTFRVADDHRKREHDGDHAGRKHHEDDDDDDEDEGGASALPQTGPTDPAAPVPANGLFDGKARPKVEVR